jgi:hypothetical protein
MGGNTNYIIIGHMKQLLNTHVWLVSLNWCVLNFLVIIWLHWEWGCVEDAGPARRRGNRASSYSGTVYKPFFSLLFFCHFLFVKVNLCCCFVHIIVINRQSSEQIMPSNVIRTVLRLRASMPVFVTVRSSC